MFIASTKSRYTPPRRPAPKAVVQKEDDVRIPFKERVVTHAIVGASLGAITGERIGNITSVGAVSFAGMTIGEISGIGPLGGLIGGIVGAGAGLLIETKFPIGKTLGGAAGFISGGIVGGISGTVVAGASSLLQ